MSRRRCATYTRKSTEDGLEQDFNSLDAQREACEAYVASQAGEGWKLVRSRYDDGGISGGTLDRPALQRLLTDIKARKVDTVVVYKVDRLTRSLADFAKIVEVFDGHGVAFVSVTQQFNTTTSMGRLTLNMLLSFAQFEREVTGERIRDKIAASKKKGLWMGGVVPLGYDAVDRKLVIIEAEAGTVRRLFQLNLELGTVRRVKVEADRLGIITKRRRKKDGRQTGGRPFTRGNIYLLLSNAIYIGRIRHKGETYPGQHRPIIDEETWGKVQERLTRNAVKRSCGTNAKTPSLLTGLVVDETGDKLCPTHASKRGRRYRYYISKRLMHDADRHHDGWRLPARELEEVVVTRILELLRNPQQLFEALGAVGQRPASLDRIMRQAELAATELVEGNDKGRHDTLREVVFRVEISTLSVTIKLGRSNLAKMLKIPSVPIDPHVDELVTLTAPVERRRRGVEARLVIPGSAEPRARPDPQLCDLIAQAHLWFEEIASGEAPSVRAIAKRHKIHETEVSRALPLAFLAPDIVAAILEGHQPVEMTAKSLRRISDLPLDWRQQRRLLGFAT